MRILAVDDDETMRELLRETLRIRGFADVIMAASGREALKKINAANTPFDCFMLDIQMPNMDGIELCSIIREVPEYAKTPILMITAMGQKDYIDRAFLAGATDYVTKPFDVLELQTRVQLAEKLQSEIKRANARDKQDKTASGRSTRPRIYNRDFHEPIDIDGVERVINLTVLQNYVAQLAFLHHFSTGAFGIKILQLRMAFVKLSEEDFSYLLTDMAQVIADAFTGTQAFVSYIGSGIFLCVGPKGKLPLAEEFSSILLSGLNDSDQVFARGMSGGFEAIVGDIASPGFFSAAGPCDFMVKAVDRVEQAERRVLALRPRIIPKRVVRHVA